VSVRLDLLPHLALFVVAEPEILPVEEGIDRGTIDDRIVQIELVARSSLSALCALSVPLLWL